MKKKVRIVRKGRKTGGQTVENQRFPTVQTPRFSDGTGCEGSSHSGLTCHAALEFNGCEKNVFCGEIKRFAHFLIDRSENDFIWIGDMPELVLKFLGEEIDNAE